MCGIVGILEPRGQKPSQEILEQMTHTLEHRGPDGQGCFVDESIGLGHRRLAILDLSERASQPMHSPDSRYVLSYNGEIYNFSALRTELEQEGCTFKSHSDTEVVLWAYIKWGKSCLDRFNGMFAFALWDRIEQTLFIARDRYGKKPLYYFKKNGLFIFASEIKALLAHPAYTVSMDKKALLEYFTFQNFFTDRTLFKGVRLFPPGHFVFLSSDEPNQWAPQQYWDFCFEEPSSPEKEKVYIEEMDRLFNQAVKRQLVSDVPVGAYLSGGIDSGSITAIASKEIPNLTTFTTGFDLHSASGMELSFDEREKAEYMSYLFKTEHYEMVLKAGDMERVFPAMAHHLEEPRVGQSYPNYYTSQLASKFVKVVLAGTGGDELFAGYPWRYYKAVVNQSFEDYIDKYYLYWQRLIPNRSIRACFSPIWEDVKDVWTRDIFKSIFPDTSHRLTRPEDYINHSLYLEAKTFLQGLLMVEDKLSMAHGLETRVPFLDNDLVDFAMKVPTRYKLGNLTEVVRINENEHGHKPKHYFEKTHDGKLLLRKVMARYVPKEVSQRAKQGFSAPDASWFKGESIDYVKRRLFNAQAPIYNFLDPKPVQDLLQDHLEGKINRRLLVWSLLSVDQWCETFLRSA